MRKCIGDTENDINGRQRKAYRILKNLNKRERDRLTLYQKRNSYIISLTSGNKNSVSKHGILNTSVNVDFIILDELQGSLNYIRNKTGYDCLNRQLYEHSSIKFKIQVLY